MSEGLGWSHGVGVGGGVESRSWGRLSKVMPKNGKISGYRSLKIVIA